MANVQLSSEDKKYLEKLGTRIKSIRLEKKWSLEETEHHGWNDWKHLQKIESGKNITVVTLRKIAKLYKISQSKLLEGL